MKIKEGTYNEFIEAFRKCYAKEYQDLIPVVEKFNSAFDFSNNEFDLTKLRQLASSSDSNYLKSIALRIELVYNLRNSREGIEGFDLDRNWSLLYKSLIIVDTKTIISSIGSQGFLSIPIFKFDSKMEDFEFYRFHVWHKRLEDFFDIEKSKVFSLHSHSFLATSWILSGTIVNEKYLVEKTESEAEYSLFKIEYNKTLNDVNEHTSSAVNTNKRIIVIKTSYEKYYPKGIYSIEPGEFHKSESLGRNGLSATLFCFSTKKEVIQSYVTGPSATSESKINRKMHIDPTSFIEELNENIIRNE